MYECPKCGFLQPKDKYCANCGVDIDIYLNQHKVPAHIKFLNDPVVQISGLLLGVFLVIMFIYTQSGPSPETVEPEQSVAVEDKTTIVTPPKSAPTAQKTQAKKSKGQRKKQQKKTLLANAPQPTKAPAPQVDSKALQLAALDKLKGGSANTQEETAKSTTPTRMKIRFAEVTRARLDKVFSSGTDNNEVQFIRSSVVPNDKSIRELFPNVSFLPGRKNVRLPMTAAFKVAFPDSESEFGLKVQLRATDPEANPQSLNLTVVLNLVAADNTPLPAGEDQISNIALSAKHYNLIEINLPHQKLLESFSSKLSGSPLSIFDSQEFLDSQTTLLVVIDAQ